MSQTQLANFMTTAGVLVVIAQKFGLVLETNQTAFVLFALWTLAWSGYNFFQRFKKGDITLGGFKK